MCRRAHNTRERPSKHTAPRAVRGWRRAVCAVATRGAARATTRFPSVKLRMNERAPRASRTESRPAVQGRRLVARGLLLGAAARTGHRDHLVDDRGDARAVSADREADPLDDPDAAGPAGDQEDPAAIQGRPGEAERGAAEVLPREQDQPDRRLLTDLGDPSDRNRGVSHVPKRRADPPSQDRAASKGCTRIFAPFTAITTRRRRTARNN